MTTPIADEDLKYREDLNEFVIQNMGIAGAVAREIRRKTRDLSYGRFSFEELCQSAYFGLVKAAAYFDPETSQFSTYAWHSCYRQVFHDLRLSQLIRGPSKPKKLSAEAAERAAKCAAIRLVDTAEYPDRFEDRSSSCGEEAEDDDEQRRYREIVATLPERWRLILARRLAGVHLRAIGDELGVTKERVRQIEAQTIREIRKQLGYEPLVLRTRDRDGQKFCPACKASRPGGQFYHDPHTAVCKACKRARTNRTYFARKEVAR